MEGGDGMKNTNPVIKMAQNLIGSQHTQLDTEDVVEYRYY